MVGPAQLEVLDGQPLLAAPVAQARDPGAGGGRRRAAAVVAPGPRVEIPRDGPAAVGRLAEVGHDGVAGAVDLEDRRAVRAVVVERAVAAGDGCDRGHGQLAADARGEPAAVGDAGGVYARGIAAGDP